MDRRQNNLDGSSERTLDTDSGEMAGPDAQNHKQRLTVNNNNSARPSTASSTGAKGGGGSPAQVYGWGRYQPKFLQRFCSAKWALFWLCWAGAMQGLIVNGFINVVITTIEKRFGLRSKQTGLMASGYDIASFVCLVPVTYFGGRIGASKPYFIACGILLMGLGSFVFALPHFLVSPYRAITSYNSECHDYSMELVQFNTSSAINGYIADTEHLSWTVWFFFVAQLMHGAGAAPLFTLGVTYIDENVSKKMSSVYLGIYYTMAIIGPAVGYVLGGQFLLIYTNVMSVDAARIGLTSESNVWIGAWWIGFVFAAAACVLLSIPLFGFPKTLPGAARLQELKVSEAYNANRQCLTENSFTQLKELPRALVSLLRNPTFFFLNLAGASEGMIIAGFAAFLPKQIENQFSISPVWSALLMGLITVPAGGGGTFIGGYLVKRLNVACAGIIKMCLITTAAATCFTICFLLSCPNINFAGITTNYPSLDELPVPIVTGVNVNHMVLGIHLDSVCNRNCSCDKTNYDPVCGSDSIMYYNPCYAGCKAERSAHNFKSYINCSCVAPSKDRMERKEAMNMMCKTTCEYLPYFAALCFVLMLLTFLATMPALSATLRCVHDDQRSFALGIQWIKVRLLGTIPAPMIFGTLIDETCILWQIQEDQTATRAVAGACLVYDNKFLSKYMWMLALGGKFCSVLFFFGAWWFYIPPNQAGEELQHVENIRTIAIKPSADREKTYLPLTVDA